MNRIKIAGILAFLASIVTAAQAVVGLISGSIACFNDGCRIVEGLAAVPPLFLNLLGAGFFQTVFWSLQYRERSLASRLDLTGLLLLCGLAFDSALLAYQIFVARTFCSYCLLVFAVVIVLNMLYNQKQMATGLAIFSTILISFSVLTFLPVVSESNTFSLKSAAYGLKSCSSPNKEVYLIFSSKCPHCQNVLELLNDCNSCDLYLNPIENVQLPPMEGLELSKDFSPEINRLVLSVLGIDSVPVLVVKNHEGYRFIKGEDNIMGYILEACFTHDDVLIYNGSFDPGGDAFTSLTEEEGECSIVMDCAQ